MRECSAASPASSLNTGTTIDRPASLRPRARIGVVPVLAVLIGMTPSASNAFFKPAASIAQRAGGCRETPSHIVIGIVNGSGRGAGCGTMGPQGGMNGYSAEYRQGARKNGRLNVLRQRANER